MRSATDEVLAILKDGGSKDFDKKKDVDYILGASLNPEKFNQLINLGKKITDYADQAESEVSALSTFYNFMFQTYNVRLLLSDPTLIF